MFYYFDKKKNSKSFAPPKTHWWNLGFGSSGRRQKKERLKENLQWRLGISSDPLRRGYFTYREETGFYQVLRDKFFIWLFVLLCSLNFYFIFLTPYFKVKEIEILGEKLIPKGDLQKVAGDYLSGKKFWFLPHSNIFVFNKDELWQAISSSYHLANLDIEKNILDQRIVVTVEEREPVLVLKTAGDFYFVDNDGYIISKVIGDLKNYLAVESQNEILNNRLGVGNQILSGFTVDAFLNIAHRLSVQGKIKVGVYKIINSPKFIVAEKKTDGGKVNGKISEGEQKLDKQGILLEEAKAEELNPLETQAVGNQDYYYPEFTVTTERGFDIYFGNEPFKDNSEVDSQITNLLTLVEKEKLLLRKISYIDVRFIKKIFFQ